MRGGIRVPLHDRARRARLHAHRRDVVRDDVVQLAGDAHAVERDRLRRRHLALALELGGPLRSASRSSAEAYARSPM